MLVPTISDPDFAKFQEFFYRKTGIHFDAKKRYFVDKRIQERIRDTNTETFRNYFSMLRFETSGEELQQLTNLMTVNETYFFREEYQFKCLVHSILPRILERKTDRTPIRIWAIPCSSGEEPYSIALYLLEHWPQLQEWDVEIISSDIDTKILAEAREGLYSERSIHHLPPAIVRKYFTVEGDKFRIADMLRDSVQFTRVNLACRADTAAYRGFDVIFCRNLLIYFDEHSRQAAAETFYDAMNPGAFLCLGHSESMSRVSSLFTVRKFPEAIVYQKPEGAT